MKLEESRLDIKTVSQYWLFVWGLRRFLILVEKMRGRVNRMGSASPCSISSK
jgi:hypothetical protein